MDTYDPLRDYDRQPSWSPITPTSPTGKLGFPEKNTFDVHAFVDHELAEDKLVKTDVGKLKALDGSKEQFIFKTTAGPAEPDHELLHIWAEVKKALRNQLKEELRTELQNEIREELKEEVRRELQIELLEQTKEAQAIVKMEEGVTKQQQVDRELFDPFAPLVLGPIKPGLEDGDVRAIAELDKAMKEVDERMARMDEEVGWKLEEGKG